MDTLNLAVNHTIFECVSGSVSYGTNTPSSDEDVRGVFVGTPAQRLGLFHIETQNLPGVDASLTEVATIFGHFLSGAPNMLELLFINDRFVRKYSRYWEYILCNRDLFMTRQMGHKAIGFVSGMLKRSINNNRKNDPTWLAQQNKQACHGIRMGRMVSEALVTKRLEVWRPDREELVAIKEGRSDINQAWETCEELIQTLKHNIEDSPLPETPDLDAACKVLRTVTLDYWNDTGQSLCA